VPHATYFESFNNGCTDLYLPWGCSGLMILSRYPVEAVDFVPFAKRGSFWNFDGEIFVNKGVARARIRWKGLAVDVFTTHLVSYTNNPNNDNSMYRRWQAAEAARYIDASNADVKLFGGDLNALPLTGVRQPYGILLRGIRGLKDALTERYGYSASMDPRFATFGNPRNTYSDGASPERIDYLMYATPRQDLTLRTLDFSMPMFMTRDKEGGLVSLSDHEGLHCELEITWPADREPETSAGYSPALAGYDGRWSDRVDAIKVVPAPTNLAAQKPSKARTSRLLSRSLQLPPRSLPAPVKPALRLHATRKSLN